MRRAAVHERHYSCRTRLADQADAQTGAALIIALLMLTVVLLLGISAAQIALQGEKTALNDTDRLIAFQAAEAALLDAEMDIETSPDVVKSRSHLFSNEGISGFVMNADAWCGSGVQNPHLGLCRYATEPAWRNIDFMDDGSGTMSSVPYGRFTGQIFETGNGSLPAKVPRYIIEVMPDKKLGERADQLHYLYRITAIGFGAHERTQVALQTVYRKAN
jgi:type IV pilus assembly protein PilX